MTLEAWKTIKVMEEVYDEGGRITLAGLADLVRGLGGGQNTVVDSTVKKRAKDRKGAKAKQSGFVDLDATCGGKVVLSKDVSTSSGPSWSAINPATEYRANVHRAPPQKPPCRRV